MADDIEVLFVKIHQQANGDRHLTVDRWPRHTEIDDVFLKQADPQHVAVTGDTVSVTVANGQAVYELGEYNVCSRSREAWLVSSRISDWSPDDV